MKTDLNEVCKKIKNCLNLSSSSNQFEAATALKQAQFLMQKYNITESDLLIFEINEKSIDTDLMRYKFTDIKLANTIASVFDCGFYWINSKNKKFVFYGIEPNLTIAIYAYNVLLPILKKARKTYVSSLHGNYKLKNKRKLGDQFTLGWLNSIESQCKNIHPNIELQKKVSAYRDKQSLSTRIAKEIEYDSEKLYQASMIGAMEGRKVKLNHGLKNKAYQTLAG